MENSFKRLKALHTYVSSFNAKSYNFIFAFMLCSGLSLPYLNMLIVADLFSPMRVLWGGFLLVFLAGLSLKKVKLDLSIVLLLAWGFWHIVNVLVVNGSFGQAVSRCFQVGVILSIIFATHQSKFTLKKFCGLISPVFSLIVGLGFLVFVAFGLVDSEVFKWMARLIIGVRTNFSIFCAQFIALFLFKFVFDHEDKRKITWRAIASLALIILPFICWQTISSGRTGFVITALTFMAFGLSSFGFRGAIFAVAAYVASTLCIEFLLENLAAMFAFFTDSKVVSISLLNDQQGMFRLKTTSGKISFLDKDQIENLSLFLTALDNLLSMRLTLLLGSLDAINRDMLLFGYGLGNMLIWNGYQFMNPHVEVLRFLLELGLIGMTLAGALYLIPTLKRPQNSIELFSLLYMAAFLFGTLAQPSGPLSHLNSAVLFWMVYAQATKVVKSD